MTLKQTRKPEWYTGDVEVIGQRKKNKKDKEVAEALEKKQLPKGKEMKLKRDFYLYVGDAVFNVWNSGYGYRFVNLSNNKVYWISPGEEKILGKLGDILVDGDDIIASRKHLKLRVDKENNLFLCDISTNGTFIDDVSEKVKGLTTLQMFQDLTGETGERNFKPNWEKRLTYEKYKKIRKIKDCFHVKICGTDGRRCKNLCEFTNESIEKFISNKETLSKIMNNRKRNMDMVIFYLSLEKKGLLNNFIETYDYWDVNDCDLGIIEGIEDIDFEKVKNMKSYIRLRNKNIIFDIDSVWRINTLESLEYIQDSSLLRGVEIGQENYVILNDKYLGTEHIRAEKVGENEYIINANMPSSPVLARRAFVLLFQNLPKGAKIAEKESLSCDSFPLVMHLFRDQKKYNLKVSFNMTNKIQLNSQGLHSKLSQLVKSKHIGKKGEKFETSLKEDAEEIVHEINKLIYKYTCDSNIYAELKENRKDSGKVTWGIVLPGFEIKKYSK